MEELLQAACIASLSYEEDPGRALQSCTWDHGILEVAFSRPGVQQSKFPFLLAEAENRRHERTLYVAFPGDQDWPELVMDFAGITLAEVPETFESLSSNISGKVQRGLAVRAAGFPFKLLDDARGANKSIRIVGHSLGAGLATVVGLLFLTRLEASVEMAGLMMAERFRVLTFGAPFVVDREMAHCIKHEGLGGFFHHVYLRHDMIPKALMIMSVDQPSSKDARGQQRWRPNAEVRRFWEILQRRLIQRSRLDGPQDLLSDVQRRAGEELFQMMLGQMGRLVAATRRRRRASSLTKAFCKAEAEEETTSSTIFYVPFGTYLVVIDGREEAGGEAEPIEQAWCVWVAFICLLVASQLGTSRRILCPPMFPNYQKHVMGHGIGRQTSSRPLLSVTSSC